MDFFYKLFTKKNNMEEYNLFDHGDILEHEAVDMIRERFPYYELVWKIYIGNGGKATKADIPGYSFDQKRQNFSEHTYTVLESIYIINQIIESKVFISKVSSFQEYLEFNKSFISFFAHLGRSRDNIIKAAEILQIGNENVTKIRSGLAETYKARCIVIHGKKIPLQLDEDGLIKIPILGTSEQKAFAWNDKTHNWPDAIGMAAQRQEFSIVSPRTFLICRELGSMCRAIKTIEPIRRAAKRGFEFL